MANKKILKWTNPTARKDGSAYGLSENAGYQISIDGGAAIPLPGIKAATTFDLSTLPEYKALAAGVHSVAISAVDVDGEVSPASVAAFSISHPPAAPGNVVVE
jgi:hypothetical protein